MTTLASIIREALNDVDSYKPDLKDSLRKAVEISKKAILHEEDLPIAGIRGPPGTGKTKVMEGLVLTEEVMGELLNDEYKFIYVAPTNELTTSGFARTLRAIIKMLSEPIDKILSKIRIYGSARPSPYFGNDLNELKKVARVSEDVLEKMVSGGIDEATFIFTTSYQSISSKMRGSHYKFVLFVDEASKMPFHLPFNPTSDAQLRALAQRNPGVLHGLVIVGDERQAVAIGPEYQGYGKSLLALPKIEEILDTWNLKQKLFMTLDTTFRLPEPTQQPIGDGFYYDTGIQLRAIEDAQKRLGNRLRDIGWIEGLNRCRNLVSDKGNLWSKVIDSVESALSSFIPVIMVNTENFIKPGENSEPLRVKLAAYYALSLKCSLGNNVGISVIAPYIDLVEDTRSYLRKMIGGANVNIRFLTVQSMLGGEDDIIISLLGKEWTKNNADYDEGETIYFIEPENLNVQLSRHRLMLIVIGNLQKLRNSAAKAAQREELHNQPTEASRIRITMDSLLRLADISANENKQVRNVEPFKEGKHAIFMKVNQ